MFQHSSNNKKCFTIESLVGKDPSSFSGSAEEPIRPTALRFPDSLHPAAGVFGSCFQSGSGGRTLYASAGPDLVLQEPGTHSTQSPAGLPLHALQIPPPPQSFFSPQHREHALSFYPWVLRSRYLGHRFQGEPDLLQQASSSS
ncbi:homeobox protein EMX1-like [Scomber japonicus]|uniref:homeobox protein EMX1-like n=1 Tax=Scomber japonicus TaxID=13676 RepID=UPI0023069380|nr:homeobox protein EMX1-like [Scomber japonicus]